MPFIKSWCVHTGIVAGWLVASFTLILHLFIRVDDICWICAFYLNLLYIFFSSLSCCYQRIFCFGGVLLLLNICRLALRKCIFDGVLCLRKRVWVAPVHYDESLQFVFFIANGTTINKTFMYCKLTRCKIRFRWRLFRWIKTRFIYTRHIDFFLVLQMRSAYQRIFKRTTTKKRRKTK